MRWRCRVARAGPRLRRPARDRHAELDPVRARVVAAWKLGAIPVPVRWDLPDWERARLRDTVDAAVYLDESRHRVDRPLDRRPARTDHGDGELTRRPPRRRLAVADGHLQQRLDRDAEGHRDQPPRRLPRRVQHADDGDVGARCRQPQTILVVAPMYHSTGFTTLSNMLGGDHLVILAEVRRGPDRRRHRASSHHHVHRDADDAQADRRPARHRRARPVEHRVDPAGRGADAARASSSGGSN